MILNKKGISPLIATVLLIGFTVALAAVVMTWGLDYIRGTTESVGSKTEQTLLCASELDFEIISADCATPSIRVQNNGAVNIANLTFRIYQGTGDITPITVGGVNSLGVRTYDSAALGGASFSGATKVEAVATVIDSNNKLILCKDQVEEYTLTGC